MDVRFPLPQILVLSCSYKGNAANTLGRSLCPVLSLRMIGFLGKVLKKEDEYLSQWVGWALRQASKLFALSATC